MNTVLILLLSLYTFIFFFFFFNDTATTEIYTLSLHDALPISLNQFERRRGTIFNDVGRCVRRGEHRFGNHQSSTLVRSEEHTSELQSPCNLVCRLLLEKKKKKMRDDVLE